uniref:Large ribosomal subunit protein uL29m n=1 Tax=Oncorhynchus mykiss TaxID=8022 RepID=A0A8C7LMD9_ONCMY
NAFRISTPLSAQQSALTLTKSQSYTHRLTSPLFSSSSHCHVGLLRQCRPLHTTISRRGLEEFFDIPENWGEATVKSGAPWMAKQLRTKSNEDLHKLWYVLLKEKNMLLTTEQESKRQRIQMPSPERLKKVDDTALLTRDTVVKEREDALRLLQTGQERARPGVWRKDVFGRVYWYGLAVSHPLHMNKRCKRFYTPLYVTPHMRLRLEKHLRAKNRKQNGERQKQAGLQEKFPQMKARTS